MKSKRNSAAIASGRVSIILFKVRLGKGQGVRGRSYEGQVKVRWKLNLESFMMSLTLVDMKLVIVKFKSMSILI